MAIAQATLCKKWRRFVEKAKKSLKFFSALHLLVLNKHKEFNVGAMDSLRPVEEQSLKWKERKKETGKKKKNLMVENKKSHHHYEYDQYDYHDDF